jgi:hypothetical protein
MLIRREVGVWRREKERGREKVRGYKEVKWKEKEFKVFSTVEN